MKPAAIMKLFALIGVLLGALSTPDAGTAVLILTALAIASIDTTAVVTVRNLVVVYYFLIFGVGPYAIQVSDRTRVQQFGVLLFAAFLVGVMARATLRRKGFADPATEEIPHGTAGTGGRRGAVLLKIAIAVEVIPVLLNVRQYGLSSFTSGGSLAGNITSFAAAGGLTNTQIITLAFQALAAALIASYVRVNEPERRYDWRLLTVALIVVPLFGLQRGTLLENTLVLLFVYRLSTAMRPAVKRARSRVTVVLGALVIAAVGGVGIGLLRAGQLPAGSSSDIATQNILRGELSPVIVIDDAIAPNAPRFHGAALFVPLLERYVPHRLDPGKPDNTTARYMKLKDPAAFAAGYSLATTSVGAIVLNFGVLGATLLSLTIGFVLGGGSRAYPRSVGAACIVYFALYGLLRNDPVNSVSYAAVVAIGYCAIMGVYRRRQVTVDKHPRRGGSVRTRQFASRTSSSGAL